MREPPRNSSSRSVHELRLVLDMQRRLKDAQRRNRIAPKPQQRPPKR